MQPHATDGFRFFDLKGRTVLVTGVTRGIGRALVPGLLAQGLNLVLLSRGGTWMEALRQETGVGEDRLRMFECDLGDRAAVDRAAREITTAGSPIDGILHNAAIDPRHWFETGGEALWDQVFQVNLFSALTLTRLLLPLLRKSGQGRILFTGSVLAAILNERL